MLTGLRPVLYVLLLAGRRLTRRSGRVLFVALGIGAGSATLATLLVASTIARDRRLAKPSADVPPEQRVFVTWFGALPILARYEARLDPSFSEHLLRSTLGLYAS